MSNLPLADKDGSLIRSGAPFHRLPAFSFPVSNLLRNTSFRFAELGGQLGRGHRPFALRLHDLEPVEDFFLGCCGVSLGEQTEHPIR